MKNGIIIFLLLVLTSPFWGTYIYFHIERINTRMEVKGKLMGKIGKAEMVVLKFTKEETETKLTWKHAGEFEYRDHMYDIIEKREEGDSIWYSCFNDIKETRLNNEISRLVNKTLGHDPYQKRQTDKLTDFFKTVYKQDAFIWKPYASLYSIFNFSFLIFNYSSLSFSPPSPPPKLG